MDEYGDNVQCHINNVTLIDVWKNTEKELRDPKLAERFSTEQLEEARKHSYDALEQCCAKGMCHIGIEYECNKNYDLPDTLNIRIIPQSITNFHTQKKRPENTDAQTAA